MAIVAFKTHPQVIKVKFIPKKTTAIKQQYGSWSLITKYNWREITEENELQKKMGVQLYISSTVTTVVTVKFSDSSRHSYWSCSCLCHI